MSATGKLERLTPDELGLDEIVATGCDFHMERIDDAVMWFNISGGPSNKRWSLAANLFVKDKKLHVILRPDD